jgi:competence protein ComGD
MEAVGVRRKYPFVPIGFHPQQGFTLVEMVMVIGIVSIVLTLVIPLFHPTEQVLEYERFFQLLEDDLFLAQQSALSNSTVIEVEFNIVNKFYTVRDRYGDLIVKRSLPEGLSVSTNFDRNRIRYNRQGNISQGGRLFFVYKVGERTKMKTYVFQVGTGRYRVE